ncbi:MAG: HylII [Thermoleophilia bacterium]|nr:HylII [Thermoleophilia bacterium]
MTRDDVREEFAHLRDEAAILWEAYLARPLLRGISHLLGFFTAIGAGLAMAIQAGAAIQLVASLIYGAGLALALGTSAMYHRIRWRPGAYQRIRKLDHSMIFVLIASSATPIALLALQGGWRVAAVAMIWTLAAAGITLRWIMATQPRWMMVAMYVGMGWATLAMLPALRQMSTQAFTLTIVGGALYTFGALVYLFKKPNPLPRIFGFHEVFHAFVVAAATCHFLAVWPLVTTAVHHSA